MNQSPHDFDALLRHVLQQAKEAGLPVASGIEPHVTVNRRAKKRFGMCTHRNGRYSIELSVRLLEATEAAVCQTLAHELIHTCPGCDNHGPLFRRYAALMNRQFGYRISRTSSAEEMGLTEDTPSQRPRYLLQCRRCGKLLSRVRCSAVIAHPERYLCICGGKWKRIR